MSETNDLEIKEYLTDLLQQVNEPLFKKVLAVAADSDTGHLEIMEEELGRYLLEILDNENF